MSEESKLNLPRHKSLFLVVAIPLCFVIFLFLLSNAKNETDAVKTKKNLNFFV
jgi:hypothetical protein